MTTTTTSVLIPHAGPAGPQAMNRDALRLGLAATALAHAIQNRVMTSVLSVIAWDPAAVQGLRQMNRKTKAEVW